jgi:hypothetical protein
VPRFFTHQQAEALLAELEPALREALSIKSELEASESRLRSTAEHVMFAGGVRLDRDKIVAELKRREELAEALRQRTEAVQDRGCLIKDLDVGLLDFPTLFRGEEVYLCWKLGERGISFWHSVDEGFQGRKAIDADFLAEHRGE